MTRPDPRPDLLDAIDASVRALTGVETREAASRHRTLVRLADATPPTHRTTARRLVWATASALTVLAVVAIIWAAREPKLALTAGTSARSARPAERRVPPAPRLADSTPLRHRDLPAPLAPPAQRPRPRAKPPLPQLRDRPDRLAAFIQAVRQLPPDVWERVDKAGPPAPLPELGVGEMSTTPIVIEPLTEHDGTSIPSLPPGGTP